MRNYPLLREGFGSQACRSSLALSPSRSLPLSIALALSVSLSLDGRREGLRTSDSGWKSFNGLLRRRGDRAIAKMSVYYTREVT